METQTTVEIKSETQNLHFGYWDAERKRFVRIDGMNDAERKRAAELLGCSPVLLDAMDLFTETIVDRVCSDLVDIWQRLNTAEIE